MPLLHAAGRITARPAPLEADRDEGWWHSARCKDPRDRDMWTSESLADRRAAAHQCVAHCPVLNQCAHEAVQQRWSTATVAGVVYDHDGGVNEGFIPRVCHTCVTVDTYEAFRQTSATRLLRRAREAT